jgi:phosphatidylglycerol:prolipoprotein diacylglycerol transferase
MGKAMAAHYVHNLDPFALRFPDWSPIAGIRWYGVCYALSFFAVFFFLNFCTRKNRSPLRGEQNWSLLGYLILGVLIGGRLGYMLLYYFDGFVARPWKFFAVWQGGMASHGGFIGVAVGIFFFCRKNNVPVLPVVDIVAAIAPLGLLLGRIANFVNGELYGRVFHGRWAVIFPNGAPGIGAISSIPPRHPSQLYEAFFEGLLLLIHMQIRLWSRKKPPPGRLVGEFLTIYSVLRIFTEHFREPDAALIFSLSRGQFYSLFSLALGVGLCIAAGRRRLAVD